MQVCSFVLVHVYTIPECGGEPINIIIIIIMHPMASAHLLIRQTYLYLPMVNFYSKNESF